MSEVKRYDPMGYDRLSGYMQQHPEGDYVRHADYAALEAERERLRGEISDLHTTMMAAAVEIQEHWAAHCDEDGYGPNNLMYRLENGIAAQYGYTAQTIVRLEAARAALSAPVAQTEQQPVLLNARRYETLRAMHWNDGALAVVANPKANVKLGVDCPSGERLDQMLDQIDEVRPK